MPTLEQEKQIPEAKTLLRPAMISVKDRLTAGTVGMKADGEGNPDPFLPTDEELKQINEFTLRDFSREELWTVTIRACDNQLDRHKERLLPSALRKLAATFKGKPGLANHAWNTHTQNFRIYSASVKKDAEMSSAIEGEPYTYLEMKVYMPRTEANAQLRSDIESGIKKETSIGFFLDWMTIKCSICGDNIFDWQGKCMHLPGRKYNGELCIAEIHDHDRLEGVENSWVAVPAQPLAGAVRSQKDADGSEDIGELISRKEKAMQGKQLLELLQNPEALQKALEGEDAEVVKGLLNNLKGASAPPAEPPTPPIQQNSTPDPQPPAQQENSAPPAPPTQPMPQTLSLDDITTAVKSTLQTELPGAIKSAVETEVKTAVGDLTQKFADLTDLVNSKLAPVPGGPLVQGTGEGDTGKDAGTNNAEQPTQAVKHAPASALTSHLVSGLLS